MFLIGEDLSYRFPSRVVFEHAGVRLGPGTRLGIVGENGSGKTTLLELLSGRRSPTSGTVRREGTVALVEQEHRADPEQCVGDVVSATLSGIRSTVAQLEAAAREFGAEREDLGDPAGRAQAGPRLARLADLIDRAEYLAAWDADRRVDVALTRLGACRDVHRRMCTLSVGERYRVWLACRLAERADFLLLDEPTNHLDENAVDFLAGELIAWRGGIAVVTHDRQLLDDVATEILDLDPSMNGRPVLYGQPGYLSYRFAKDQAMRRWRLRYQAERKRAEKLAARLDASYEGLSDEWRPPKGSQKHRRATRARIHVKAADRLIERLEEQAVEVPVPPPEFVFPELPAMSAGWDPGDPLIEVRNPLVHGETGERLDLPGVRIAIPPSGRLLLVGGNGTGKSTLLQVMAGRCTLDRGLRHQHAGVRIGCLPQETAYGDREEENRSGFDAYAAHALGLLSAGLLDPDLLVPVAALGLLTEEDLDRPLAQLSVGQRRRFDLACALLAVPHLLLLDEPSNHLSIDLVDDLTRALRVTPAAVVIATHDRRMRDDLQDWARLEMC